MMEYLRKMLIWLRKKDNVKMSPSFLVRLGLTVVISIIIGIIMDLFLPFNFIFNGIRGFFANLTGLSLYSLMYLISVRFKNYKKKENRYYQPTRKRFSYRQRVNFSIVVGTVMTFFVFLSTRENFAFTMTSSILIITALTLLSFSRRNRDEFIKNIYELPDTRDLEFTKSKEENESK